MSTQLANFLTALAGFGLGILIALFAMWPERRRIREEESIPDPKYFVEAEQDAWIRYEMKVEAARDDYNAEVSRLHEIHDPDRMRRAKNRFLEALIEEQKNRKRVALLKVR